MATLVVSALVPAAIAATQTLYNCGSCRSGHILPIASRVWKMKQPLPTTTVQRKAVSPRCCAALPESYQPYLKDVQLPEAWAHPSAAAQGGHRRGGLLISANSRIEDSSRAAASWRTQTKSRRAKSYIVAASSNEGDETKEASEAPSSITEVAKPTVSEKRAQAEAEVKKGQRTAIVTGVISVLLGVGYLVLIQLLDTRGIILVPPPPEAFDP